jgi:hypothetical protein
VQVSPLEQPLYARLSAGPVETARSPRIIVAEEKPAAPFMQNRPDLLMPTCQRPDRRKAVPPTDAAMARNVNAGAPITMEDILPEGRAKASGRWTIQDSCG